MSTKLPSLFARVFTRSWLDPVIIEQGEQAGIEQNHCNPWPKGTVEHTSWKVGYDRTDDWGYVW